MTKTITINGYNIHDISSFYEEINRVFMTNETWKLSNSLDALNDMFYGGYGAISGNEEIRLLWENFEQNSEALGLEATKAYYLDKLKYPSVFNTVFVQEKLAELDAGIGKTYIEIILEIIGEHPNIKLSCL